MYKCLLLMTLLGLITSCGDRNEVELSCIHPFYLDKLKESDNLNYKFAPMGQFDYADVRTDIWEGRINLSPNMYSKTFHAGGSWHLPTLAPIQSITLHHANSDINYTYVNDEYEGDGFQDGDEFFFILMSIDHDKRQVKLLLTEKFECDDSGEGNRGTFTPTPGG